MLDTTHDLTEDLLEYSEDFKHGEVGLELYLWECIFVVTQHGNAPLDITHFSGFSFQFTPREAFKEACERHGIDPSRAYFYLKIRRYTSEDILDLVERSRNLYRTDRKRLSLATPQTKLEIN